MEAARYAEFPTIDETELIAHELINPFTPYFRDPRYRGKRVCKGFSTWQDALFDNYSKLRKKFARNCSHILGNLIISEIRSDEDIEFLNSIEEVSGYVFIRRVTKPCFGLPNLRIIRGEESVQIRGQAFTLLVTETYASSQDFMSDIEFPSLEAILMHGVGFFDNPGLCYAPFSVNWDDILEYPDLQPVILIPMNSRSATTHWITACATRYDDASRASIHATTPPSSVDTGHGEQSTTIRLRRETSEGWTAAGTVDNIQPSYTTGQMANGQPANGSFSTFDTNSTEVLPIEVVVSGTQKGDETPEVYLDENKDLDSSEGDTIITTTEIPDQAQNSTNTTQVPEGISSEFEDVLTNETFRVLWNLSSGTGPWVKWRCHDSCSKRNGRSFCWGPGANQCQLLRKCQTRVCSGPNRCVKEGGVEECCHDECVGGCSGTRANECLACRRYSHEGNCVSACPATRFYDVHTSSWKVNKEGRVALGHMCVSRCPDGFLLDGDHCVLKCSRPGTQQVRNMCVQCPPAGCPRTCSAKQLQLPSVDFLHKSLLRRMVNCTFWEGNIILKKQSFEGDAFHNLTKEEESVTFEDLQSGLGSLFEITGILYVGTDSAAPWLRNLTFLSKLRRIGGEVPPGYNSPLNIVHNNYLEYLGLASLVFIGTQRGTIQIVQNPRLCLVDTINWRALMWTPKASTTNTSTPFPAVIPHRTAMDCVSEGLECDKSVCELSQGCWGPGPENCRSCAHWLIQGRGETSRCVLNCSLAEGGYYPVMITKTIDANITLKIKSCSKCHKECGSMPGACYGPHANHCNYGCAHVKDGNYCRAECPLGKFPNEEDICQECAAVCTSHPRGLLDGTESGNWSAVCTGPGDWFGRNGCSQCIQVVATPTKNEEHGSALKCLTPYQPCPNNTFLHLIGGKKGKVADPKLEISGDISLAHVPLDLQAPLADWLISHQSQSPSVSMARVCAPCHPECQDGCSGPSPNQCVKCRNAEFNGICLASCHEGTYAANTTNGGKQCRPCHGQCSQSCTGPLASDCLFCRHYKRYLNKEKTKWVCVKSCPSDSIAHVELNPVTTAVEFVCLATGIAHHLTPTISEQADDCLIFCTPSEIISPQMLGRLSWLSTALLIFCGLLALFVAVYFGYVCSRVVILGRKSRSGLVVDQLQSGISSMCNRFWMRAVVVVEPDEGKNERRLSKSRRNISLRSLPVRSSAVNSEDEQSCLVSPQADTMPDMTTLLIIPEYQLKLGNRVGGGAFGSVYRGVWYKGPISPGFAKNVDSLLAEAAKIESEKPKLVPLDSLVEDNAYASTELEYLTMEEEDEGEAKEAQKLEKSAVPEENTELKPLAKVEEPLTSEQNTTSTSIPQTTQFNFSEACEEEGKFHMENVEEHIVAIKVLTDETDPSTSKALLDEARVMATVNHPCCLRLLALCMTARPQLVTSFLPLGCLLSYLHRHGGPNEIDRDVITPEIMLKWANQIASGMAYLASRSIIHRDLAARNVLVETPEQIKITDFGLAKCIEDTGGEYTAKGGLMPVKWLAIECIKKRIFSSKSDVWAYGVTLWEIFTLGRKPYERIHTRHLIQYLEKGLRLAQPVTTSLELYELMIECWQDDPDRRPSFDELVQRTSDMELDPQAFISFKRVHWIKKHKEGGTRLWSDSGLTASTSSYVATTINTTTTTGNTGTMLKSVSEVSVPTSSLSCLNYLAEETEEEGEVRYTASPRDDRYGIIMPASIQRQESVQPLECIVEDAEETSALELFCFLQNDYEKPNETVRRVDSFPPKDIAPAVAIVEDYLEPKEEINEAETGENAWALQEMNFTWTKFTIHKSDRNFELRGRPRWNHENRMCPGIQKHSMTVIASSLVVTKSCHLMTKESAKFDDQTMSASWDPTRLLSFPWHVIRFLDRNIALANRYQNDARIYHCRSEREAEVDLLQDRYREAAEMFARTSKAGEAFADALNGLSRCLNNLVTPSPNLPISVDREAEIQRIIRSIYTFSNLVADFSSRLTQPSNVLFQAGVKLDELHQSRKDFQRASEQVEVAASKSAGVSRSRTSDAEEADTTLLDARAAYARASESYLSLLRNVLCPVRLSTVLRATVCTFEIQQGYSNSVASLSQPDDCVSVLRDSISIYDAEISNKPRFITNGVSPTDPLDQGVRYEGYLFKRSKKKRWKTWIRRWFRVKDNQLIYFSSLSDTYTSITWKVMEPDLRLCTAKAISSNFGSIEPPTMSSSAANITDRRFVFELISPAGKVHFLQAESSEAMEKWVAVLRTGLLNSTANGDTRASNTLTTSPWTGSRESLRSLSGALLLDEPPTAGNRSCADCLTTNDVKWASTNLGVTLCTDCAACHRSLGVHISKVRSLTLDNWEPELLEVMRNLGNNLVAGVYESKLPLPSASETSSLPRRPQNGELNAQLRRAWVEAKWVRRLFVRSFVQPSATMWLLDLYRSWLLQAHSHRASRSRNSPPGSKTAVSGNLSTPSATVSGSVTFGPRIMRLHHPRLVDRRRFSTVVRGSTARAQVTLDTLCAHLDSVVFGEPRSPSSSPLESVQEKAAARLVLVAGARLGCAPLILAGLARGASPNALPAAAEWARIYRLPQPADGDPLGALTPPLISAVTGGRIAACELLLTNGADINALDQDGRTALHHACSLQRVHLVCLLLRRQANQEIRDKDGRRPIDVAIDTAHADIVTLLRLQPLHSDSKIMDSAFSIGGKDDTAIEVFRDFTTRAYHLEWDSEEEDYHESPTQSAPRDRS
ncbi:Arf-GAP with coiled-coil ANK repeat and PH domain-containing protein 2 [Taenia crassiceps]|uniref:receptor protein-tyrosine kinase n=1 Tax=Taenia crassiceps TaxID=6207 RepID=A0ABR4QMA9_9CEST